MTDPMMSLEFVHKTKKYYALVRTVRIGKETHYRATILCKALDKLLFGDHVIVRTEDGLRFLHEPADASLRAVGHCLLDTLSEQLSSKAETVQAEMIPEE